MTVRLDRAADEATARWLCHGCGERYPLDGPAYPVCVVCGQRCRMVDAAGVPFIGSPDDRLAAAHEEIEKAYAQWRGDLDFLRACLDEGPESWWGRNAPRAWSGLVMAAAYASHAAEHLDRVEAEVARIATRGEA